MRVRIVGLLEAAAAITVFFSLVTVIDHVHHAVELFVHFRLQYLVIALLLAALFAALRRNGYCLVLVVAAVLNGYFVLPWYFGAPPADGEPLKILHANVHSSNFEHERVIALVLEESPDIVVLQEVTSAWMSATHTLSSDYAFRYAEPREDHFGIAIYSRLPLITARHVNSPPLGYPTLLAQLAVAGRDLTLISSHPTIPVGGQGYAARNEQLQHVAELAREASGATVLIGDLNASIWSHSYRSFVAETGLSDARRGHGVLPTWPTFMPFAMIPIDHALVSDDVAVLDLRTGSRVGSDHLPLLLTVGL